MEIKKELSEIAWNVDEPTYRADSALSYSTLSTYEKTGFDGLDHLFDKKESPSLLLGSIVDTIITGGMEEFQRLFTVLDITVTSGGKDVCNQLISMNLPYEYFEEIPREVVSQAAKEAGFWKDDKWDKKRYDEVLKTGNIAQYYNAITHSERIIVDSKTYDMAFPMVMALKESEATAKYFAEDDEFSPIRRYYQLKFKAMFGNVVYRCMADLLVVDYENKIVYPCDLKTSGHTEWNFQESFKQWNYMIQARLYWRIIKAVMDADPYFKEFKLADYRFIVVNKTTLTPLVWEFPLTREVGTLIDEEGNEYRDPFEIGRELQKYLDSRPRVPDGIDMTNYNVITCLKKKQ